MKSLSELWAEKKTPTIKVRATDWSFSLWVEVFFEANDSNYGCKDMYGGPHIISLKESRVPNWTIFETEAPKPESKPPATRRVYQALYKDNDGKIFLDTELYRDEAHAKDSWRPGTFIHLIEPGFEIPAE